MRLDGTQTQKNLLRAFIGESVARNRYFFYADVAEQEGYQDVAVFFRKAASQEREHARQFFLHMESSAGETFVDVSSFMDSTRLNLKQALAGEQNEIHNLYPGFANTAREEGFVEIASVFDIVVEAEKSHEQQFAAFLKRIEHDTIYDSEDPAMWNCINCGFMHSGKEPPEKCLLCGKTKSYFRLFVII